MARRAKRSQAKHDIEVKRIAKELEKNGYKVKADSRGYSKPETIGGYRPDVVAQKGKEKKNS
ncbi:hypothetical protein IH824_15600 [candidate division KSB1 bacterium]|jgi:hypothetical protein|nr:hypothetical protein [candidate division KSB1 bacterium]